jgi:hypothetical protein
MLVILVVTAACLLLVAVAARRLAAAGERFDAAAVAIASARHDVDRLAELRGRRDRASLAQEPQQDVIKRVNAVLVEAGVDPRLFEGLAADSDAPLTGAAAGSGATGQYRRQSVRVSLKSIELGDLGRFLARWRQTQPAWTPTRIDLLRPATAAPPGAAGAARFEANLVLSTIYWAPGSG